MNYQSIYDRIIERNRNTPKVKNQTESHHIIPKSFAKLDGIEDINGSWNKVNLPLREHFICHLLLARIWKGHKAKGPKMVKAFTGMAGKDKYTSKDYSWIKSSLPYIPSEETRRKLSEANRKRTLSSESKIKMSESAKGKPKSEEHKRKISEARKRRTGFAHSEETKRKMSESHKSRSL